MSKKNHLNHEKFNNVLSIEMNVKRKRRIRSFYILYLKNTIHPAVLRR